MANKWLVNSAPLICCLSGLLIENPKDLSREHYVPKARAPEFYTLFPYNIHPALKIMNSIKGAMLPCEWMLLREEKLTYALDHWNLTAHNRELIIKALDRFATEKGVLDPCQYCILSTAPEQCNESRNMAGYGISKLSSFKSR